MSKALSIHIGLNFVVPDHYDGWDREVAAGDMQELARARGFKTSIMLREKPTATVVSETIANAARSLIAAFLKRF